jgi:hypothetical protein
VRRALEKAPLEGEVLYRAGCVYALTSGQSATAKEDRAKAIKYIARALKRGFGYEYVEADADLKALIGDADFTELLTETRTRKLKGWL